MRRVFPKDRLALVIILATLLFYSLMLWYPIVDQFALSLHSGLTLKRTWVGLENFQRLKSDPYFRNAIGVSFKYALMYVPITVLLGLLLAGVMNGFRKISTRTLFMSLFFFANMVPLAASASFWKFILAPTSAGALNGLLNLFGISSIKWLRNPSTALASLAMVAIWGGMGYVMVLFVGGMQAIPTQFYDAAAIDGANAWRRFLHITVPLLMPTLTFVVVILTLGSLQMFGQVYIMTGGQVSHDPKGGPAGSTTTLVWLIYETAFLNFKQGYAASIAVVWFLALLALGLTQFYLMSRRSFEY